PDPQLCSLHGPTQALFVTAQALFLPFLARNIVNDAVEVAGIALPIPGAAPHDAHPTDAAILAPEGAIFGIVVLSGLYALLERAPDPFAVLRKYIGVVRLEIELGVRWQAEMMADLRTEGDFAGGTVAIPDTEMVFVHRRPKMLFRLAQALEDAVPALFGCV